MAEPIQGHGAAQKGITDGPGRVPTQGQEQMISLRQWSGYQQRNPFGVPVKNGALLYVLLEHIRASCEVVAWDH